MCGRYTLKAIPEIFADQFNFEELSKSRPRYNIAPSQLVACVRFIPRSQSREGAMLRWGLIPSWAKDLDIGMKLINARAETVNERPSFQKSFRHRRCLVLADGFYEWRREERIKQPYYIRMKDERPFAFAGLWEYWTNPDGQVVESCALITTASNELMIPIHNRMPVIVDPDCYDEWLDPMQQEIVKLNALLRPYPAEYMMAYPVDRLVNNVSFDDSRCIEPLVEQG